MTTFKLTVAYDGTGLVGWQRQRSGISIQGLLEGACAALEGGRVRVTGAGRTDAGVHALGQVASVTLTRDIDPATLIRALNVRLPPTVRVLDAQVAAAGFHARFAAVRKSYRYRICNNPVLLPFERAYAWHVPAPRLDVAAMAGCAKQLEGVHDFAAFQGAGSGTHSSVRTVFSSRLSTECGLITYEIAGDGFLRYMVRSIVGTLVEVGRGRGDAAWFGRVLAARDRAGAGRTAPPEGLFLVAVEYSDGRGQ